MPTDGASPSLMKHFVFSRRRTRHVLETTIHFNQAMAVRSWDVLRVRKVIRIRILFNVIDSLLFYFSVLWLKYLNRWARKDTIKTFFRVEHPLVGINYCYVLINITSTFPCCRSKNIYILEINYYNLLPAQTSALLCNNPGQCVFRRSFQCVDCFGIYIFISAIVNCTIGKSRFTRSLALRKCASKSSIFLFSFNHVSLRRVIRKILISSLPHCIKSSVFLAPEEIYSGLQYHWSVWQQNWYGLWTVSFSTRPRMSL